MAVKLDATGKLSCHGATAVLYHSMYANVATGPRSRLKQGFVCNTVVDNICMHLSTKTKNKSGPDCCSLDVSTTTKHR